MRPLYLTARREPDTPEETRKEEVMAFSSPSSASSWLTETAAAFMQSPDNDLNMPGGHEPAFGEPLVGFSAGSDPLWNEYKEYVGEYHWTPLEAFALAYPGERVTADELYVMSWVLPQTEVTRRDNRKEKALPAERWVRARIFGEETANNGLRKCLLNAMHDKGIQALAPVFLPDWSRRPSEKYVYASNWSERHAAYTAGLGTFGLCDGLITPLGKAMRVGSLIVRLPVSVTSRPYTHHQEYCLFFSSGTCGVCMRRCPVGAISENGHDKLVCRAFVHEETPPYIEKNWHFKGYGCGLCQVGVPCEKGIPPKPKKRG